jgi:hypothetical protein
MGYPPNVVAAKKASFLEAIRNGATRTLACEKAAIDKATARAWERKDPEFEKAVKEAWESGTDVLEDEAKRRAVDGVEEPVYQKGLQVGFVRKYSDTLLIFLLKSRSDRFRRLDAVSVTGADGHGPVEVTVRRIGTQIAVKTTEEARHAETDG